MHKVSVDLLKEDVSVVPRDTIPAVFAPRAKLITWNYH